MNRSDELERVKELLALYDNPEANVAELLCDRHRSGTRAFRFVDKDLETNDLSYGELRAESEKFADVLQTLGIKPGDRVATLMGCPSSEHLAQFAA